MLLIDSKLMAWKVILKMAEMVRINTRISSVLNEKLDKESDDTGIPKSTLVMLALENYYQQKEALKTMTDMSTVLDRIEQLEKRLSN